MSKIEIILPSLGEGVIEATLTRWLKKEGDKIEENEAIAEIATDKVDSEIFATHQGFIQKLLYKEGDTVPVGSTIAILTTDIKTEEKEEWVELNKNLKTPILHKQSFPLENNELKNKIEHKTKSGKFLSPLVRKIASEENISPEELEQIYGSGIDNRVTKDDIIKYLSKRNNTEKKQTNLTDKQPQQEKLIKVEGFEIIEMDRIRRIISDAMVNSKRISPHVTSFTEVDMTNIVNWRNQIKNSFQNKYNENITFTPIFIEAVAKAIKEYPLINSSVDNSKIIKKTNINIGMATALPNGNLIVPVIKNADQLNLLGLTKKVNDLANRARSNKLTPDEIQGGTFTITNLGSFGSITGTPIINQPEVAILATGAIKKKPAVIETPIGDAIAIRHIMILSLSYDHRIIDGYYGGMFLKKIGDLLEAFDAKIIL